MSAANAGKLGIGLSQGRACTGEIARQPHCSSAQLKRLAVEDRDLLLGQERGARRSEPARRGGFGAEARGGRSVDHQRLDAVGRIRRAGRHRLVELGHRGLGIAPVQQVHCAVIAELTRNDRVRADQLGSPAEQGVGLVVTAEVRLLQRFVGQPFGLRRLTVAALADRREELRRFRHSFRCCCGDRPRPARGRRRSRPPGPARAPRRRPPRWWRSTARPAAPCRQPRCAGRAGAHCHIPQSLRPNRGSPPCAPDRRGRRRRHP